MNRAEKIQSLTKQYAEEFSVNGYPVEFLPHGSKTECNFGGLLVIISNDRESVICWRDWADDAIDDKLEECEIYHKESQEDFDEDGNPEFIPFFKFKDEEICLSDFIKL